MPLTVAVLFNDALPQNRGKYKLLPWHWSTPFLKICLCVDTRAVCMHLCLTPFTPAPAPSWPGDQPKQWVVWSVNVNWNMFIQNENFQTNFSELFSINGTIKIPLPLVTITISRIFSAFKVFLVAL